MTFCFCTAVLRLLFYTCCGKHIQPLSNLFSTCWQKLIKCQISVRAMGTTDYMMRLEWPASIGQGYNCIYCAQMYNYVFFKSYKCYTSVLRLLGCVSLQGSTTSDYWTILGFVKSNSPRSSVFQNWGHFTSNPLVTAGTDYIRVFKDFISTWDISF